MDFELVVITARGTLVEEIENANRLFDENNIVFDNHSWNVNNKLEVCKKENIDVMIDDDYKIIKQLSDAKIKTLYFRDADLKKLNETQYIHEVNNWGDVYRYLTELNPS